MLCMLFGWTLRQYLTQMVFGRGGGREKEIVVVVVSGELTIIVGTKSTSGNGQVIIVAGNI